MKVSLFTILILAPSFSSAEKIQDGVYVRPQPSGSLDIIELSGNSFCITLTRQIGGGPSGLALYPTVCRYTESGDLTDDQSPSSTSFSVKMMRNHPDSILENNGNCLEWIKKMNERIYQSGPLHFTEKLLGFKRIENEEEADRLRSCRPWKGA